MKRVKLKGLYCKACKKITTHIAKKDMKTMICGECKTENK